MPASAATGPWGQTHGDYIWMPGTIFLMSLGIPLAHRSGFKLHVSVHPDDAEPLARLALPLLRQLHVHHKVVRSPADYERMDRGTQRGKFITVYPGPGGVAQRVVNALDAALVGRRLRIGPLPATRQSRHAEHEIPVGQSGMISSYWCGDYEND
jgi:hypothetical protein